MPKLKLLPCHVCIQGEIDLAHNVYQTPQMSRHPQYVHYNIVLVQKETFIVTIMSTIKHHQWQYLFHNSFALRVLIKKKRRRRCSPGRVEGVGGKV